MKLINRNNSNGELTLLQCIGVFFLVAGCAVLATLLFKQADDNASTFAAMGFLSIMLSIVFIFPNTLTGGKNDTTSTMRIAVFMVVGVFVFLCVKSFWKLTSLKDFALNGTWGVIIAAAFGGKAIQSLGENNVFSKPSSSTPPPIPGPKSGPPVVSSTMGPPPLQSPKSPPTTPTPPPIGNSG